MSCRTWAGALALGGMLALGALSPGAAPASEGRAATSPADARWVVGLDGAAAARRAVGVLRAGGEPATRLPELDALVLRDDDARALIATLPLGDDVTYVERARPRQPLAEPADALDPRTGRAFTWAFDAVGAGPGLAAAGGGAPTSPIAVVDTGVDRDHPDLAGRVSPGHDVAGSGSVADDMGHGTFVAGLIGAIDGNGIGGKGVAGRTSILPVRVSRATSIDSADLAAGIVWAVDNGAKVINISLGGAGYTAVERAAIDYARARDVVLVASAGNAAEEGNPVIYPAAAIGGESGGWGAGLSVGATDPAGRRAGFSTHNRFVTIAAPGAGSGACGDGVYSAIPSGPGTLWDSGCDDPITTHGPGRYAYGQGTSFSAPLVAGAAALVRQVEPRLRADQVADVLRRTARPAGAGGWSAATGAGVLDVGAAVALGRLYDVTAPEVSVSLRPVAGGTEVSVAAGDRGEEGRELSDGVSVTVEQSRDGSAYTAIDGGSAGATATVVAGGDVTSVRVRACDRNRNCAERALAVEATPVVPAPAPVRAAPAVAPAPATLRPRGPRVVRLLAFAPTRHCRGARPCLRAVWRAAGDGDAVRFTAQVSEQGRPGVVARARGSAITGRRTILQLRPARPLRCGRVVLRLTVHETTGPRTVSRRAAVRSACRAPGGRRR